MKIMLFIQFIKFSIMILWIFFLPLSFISFLYSNYAYVGVINDILYLRLFFFFFLFFFFYFLLHCCNNLLLIFPASVSYVFKITLVNEALLTFLKYFSSKHESFQWPFIVYIASLVECQSVSLHFISILFTILLHESFNLPKLAYSLFLQHTRHILSPYLFLCSPTQILSVNVQSSL